MKKKLKPPQHNQDTRELVVVERQSLQLLEIYQLRWDGACSESANKNQQEVKQEIPNIFPAFEKDVSCQRVGE